MATSYSASLGALPCQSTLFSHIADALAPWWYASGWPSALPVGARNAANALSTLVKVVAVDGDDVEAGTPPSSASTGALFITFSVGPSICKPLMSMMTHRLSA